MEWSKVCRFEAQGTYCDLEHSQSARAWKGAGEMGLGSRAPRIRLV